MKTKLKIKKLSKSIKIVISIHIKSYRDKLYSNNYCSARATVNYCYDTEQIYAFTYNSPDQMEREIINDLVTKFAGLDKITDLHYASQAREQGVLVNTTIDYCTQSECKRFGKV